MTKSHEEQVLEQLQEMNKKMEVVIALLLRLIPRKSKGLPLKDQIAALNGMGIRPIAIAAMVGKKVGHVNKELVAIRKMQRGKTA